MKIKIIAYGIAKDILQNKELSYELNNTSTIGDLKANLLNQYPKFAALASLRFAVGEEYQEDGYELLEGHEVVIIPPVSGG